MSTDPRSDPRPRLLALSPRKLWFGFAGAVFSWIALGCADTVIIWRGCMHQQDYGCPASDPWVRALIFAVTLLLLAVTVGAGMISYRNYRWLSEQRKMLDSLAVPRGEFMAVIGVILSVTLSISIVWAALPPFFLELCWRAK